MPNIHELGAKPGTVVLTAYTTGPSSRIDAPGAEVIFTLARVTALGVPETQTGFRWPYTKLNVIWTNNRNPKDPGPGKTISISEGYTGYFEEGSEEYAAALKNSGLRLQVIGNPQGDTEFRVVENNTNK